MSGSDTHYRLCFARGGYKFNQRLARRRAENLAKYLRGQADIPDSLLSIESAGIDWAGLESAVSASDMTDKGSVLEIIRTEPEFTYDGRGVLIRSRKQQLQNLNGGRTWMWMLEHLYPALRSSASVVCYIERAPRTTPVPVTEEPVVTEERERVEEPTPTPPEPEETEGPQYERLKYPVMALRTNLLLPALNVGVEVPVARHWSVGADYYYPWVPRKADHKDCFQLIFVSAEARYWFDASKNEALSGRNYLKGHSIGLYGAWGYYDFEKNYHGHQGHGWSVGADYQFALPIAKNRMRLEFELAAGYMWSPAQPYNVREEGGHLIREKGVRKTFRYFGPTKGSVSLVLPLWRSVKREIRGER